MTSPQLLFVYGSLKQGFPNFHVNGGRRLAGVYRTQDPHPFFLVDGQLPCLLPAFSPAPGGAFQVRGELFEVDEGQLARMDALERVGEPGGYTRATIAVQRVDLPPGADADAPQDPAHAPVMAQVYLQDPQLLRQRPGPHLGPLVEYTPEHAARLSW